MLFHPFSYLCSVQKIQLSVDKNEKTITNMLLLGIYEHANPKQVLLLKQDIEANLKTYLESKNKNGKGLDILIKKLKEIKKGRRFRILKISQVKLESLY